MEKNQRFVSTLSVKALGLNPPVACGDSPPSSGALGIAESSPSLPRPPLLGNNDDRRQWRKQGGVVGAAASRTQVQNFARSGRWEPQPVRWHPAGMTVGFNIASSPQRGWIALPNKKKKKTALPCNARQSGISPVLVTSLPEPFSGSWRSGRGSWWGGGRRWYPPCGRWHPQPSCP